MKKLLYVLAAALFSLSAKAQTKNYHLVIGTYTAPGVSKGIYVYDFNTANAEFKQETVEKNVINPSFLTVTQDRRFVYAVNEDADRSMVSAFSFDEASGELGFLNQQKAQGTDPCYLIADDKNVLIANYSSGSIAVFGRDASGALTPAKQVVQHTGSSIDTARQKGPHVHMVRFTPDHKYIVSNDLGEDKVYFYTYNKNGDDKVLVYKNSASVKAGRGPRHIVFSPNGKFAYLIQELNADVTVFSYNDGNLKKLQDTNLATTGFKGQNGGSDIQFSADGKFLYITNRGDANTITTFAVGQNGKLLRKGQMSTGGRGPRAFVIDPSGNWLLMGHQYTNDIVIFKRNKITGELTNTGRKIDIGAPVCFVFVPKK